MNVTIGSNTFTLDFDTKPPAECVFAQDPVALSCAAYRLFTEQKILARWPDLDTIVAEEQDIVQAQQVRKYYADRLLMATITSTTGRSVSEFRQKLYGLVTNTRSLKTAELGLLYRLPYFYAEDTGMDCVVSQTQPVTPVPSHNITGVFTLLKRITVSRRSGESVQFWLQRPNDSGAYLIVVKSDNPMLSLLDSMFEQPRHLSGHAYAKNYRGHHKYHTHFQLGSVRLVNDAA